MKTPHKSTCQHEVTQLVFPLTSGSLSESTSDARFNQRHCFSEVAQRSSCLLWLPLIQPWLYFPKTLEDSTCALLHLQKCFFFFLLIVTYSPSSLLSPRVLLYSFNFVASDRAAGGMLPRICGCRHSAVSVSVPGRKLAGQRGKHGSHHRSASR